MQEKVSNDLQLLQSEFAQMKVNLSQQIQEKVSNDLQLLQSEFAQIKVNLSQQILSYEKAIQGIINKLNFSYKFIYY